MYARFIALFHILYLYERICYFSYQLFSQFPQPWFYFVSIPVKRLGMYHQSRVFSFQTLLRSLSQHVCLLPVCLWFAYVHLPLCSSRVTVLNQKPTSLTRPCLYISWYLTRTYPARQYLLICYSLANWEISHTKHRLLRKILIFFLVLDRRC